MYLHSGKPPALRKTASKRAARSQGHGATTWQRISLLALLLPVSLTAGVARASAPATALDPAVFPIPESLHPNVAFWSAIYATYTSQQALFHDDRYLDIVYQVLDFRDLEPLPENRQRLLRRQRIRDSETHWGAVLRDLAAGARREGLRRDYTHVESMFARIPGDRRKYRAALGRLRSQRCLRDTFAAGIERSGRYLPGIEEIFERRGLPRMLTRLPFVESMFQLGARSSAAAAGIWQFVPSTARRFLRMDLEVDERFDPWRAAEAAAAHLEESYQSLGSWPLAITAYNHGTAGMRRAVRQVGTRDLGHIVDHYRSRSFGFASRNFYSEFVAAATVYEQRTDLFPGVEPAPELVHERFVPDQYVSAPALATAAGIDPEQLRALNPAFDRRIWRGELLLPHGYDLRVPVGQGQVVAAAYQSLGPGQRRDHQLVRTYRVRRGDTLAAIARRFGTTVAALQRANDLRSAHLIRIGQVLRVPQPSTTRAAAAKGHTRRGSPAASRYTVRSGDTLSAIAARHGTSIGAIQGANALASTHRIMVGQRLTLPGTSAISHVVQPGDTLTAIARRYGTSVRRLKQRNQLRSSTIHPRQVLVIP